MSKYFLTYEVNSNHNQEVFFKKNVLRGESLFLFVLCWDHVNVDELFAVNYVKKTFCIFF
jgi:hypothetical protein